MFCGSLEARRDFFFCSFVAFYYRCDLYGSMSEFSVEPEVKVNDDRAPEEEVDGTEDHREPSVHVLYDVLSYFKFRIPKCKDAVWVKGLTKEDEEYAIQQLQLEEYQKEASKLAKLFVLPLGSAWLRYPNIVGFLFLAVMAYELAFPAQEVLQELVLCSSVENLMPLGIRRGESFMTLFYRIAPSILSPGWLAAATYALTISFRVGLSTHHFRALCAFGAALLYPFAVIAQFYIIFSGAFRDSKQSTETDILFFMYYSCVVIKMFSPIVAVILVYPAVALAMSDMSRLISTGLQFMTLLPLLALLWYIGVDGNFNVEKDAWLGSISVVYLTTLISWGTVLVKCFCQSTFEIPVIVPPVET